ncbi:hypothetical protein [Klebsiella sp. BIGb0407]|uniref:hypothetical protein n=1 Tax=Klebsiella sp. BIGb0407 TaxID=2940603 RepID=UPI002167CE01|nr:hypothetical protein [Klebsiella sp. BIGb0407]MCS3429900.1 hypothetical protein [Klebsiella sp. BIGb0407]
MHELSQIELDSLIDKLEQQTIDWFLKYKQLPAKDLLWRYFSDSKKGNFKDIYTGLMLQKVDHRTVHLMSFLPLLSNRLTPKIAKVIAVSRFKTQLLMNMIIYWLILYYSGKSNELPGDNESQKLIVDML